MSINDQLIVVPDRASTRYVPMLNPQEAYTASLVTVVVVLANTDVLIPVNPVHRWLDVQDSAEASRSDRIYVSPKGNTEQTILSFKDMKGDFASDETFPSPEGLIWLANSFRDHYVLADLLPAVFPTSWGGIRMEWSVDGQTAIVDIDLEKRIARWLSFYLEDEDDERDVEETLYLEGAEGWDRFNKMVQALVYTE